MPVDIVDITFLDSDFTSISTGVDYLNGSIGDKLTAEIVLDVHWETPLVEMDLIAIATPTAIRQDGGSFFSDGFQIGDNILIHSPTGLNNMVLGQITFVSAISIKFTSAGLVTESNIDTIIYGIETVRNLDFYYNILSNSTPSNLNSLIDGSIAKYNSDTISHLNPVPSPLLPNTTVNSWSYDSSDQNSTVEGVGLFDINRQRFKIIHEFYIQPVFLTGDLNTGGGSLSAPSYLDNIQSLKYVWKIDARYSTGGTVVDKSTSNGNINQFIKSGDVGWFDELGNAGVPEYYLGSIGYTDTFNSTVTTSILPNADTDISIILKSVTGTFSAIASKFLVQIYRTPESTSTYQNTATDIKENFLVSRQLLTINSAPTVAGDGFIKAGATVIYTTDKEVIIDFTFLPTFFTSQDQVLNDLQGFNQNPSNIADGYLIFVTCQDKTITSKINSDKVAVLCDVNKVEDIEPEDFYNTEGVCEVITLFNDHPTNDPLLAFTDYKGWLEDSVVTKTNIQVLKTNFNQEIDGTTIQNVWNLNTITFKVEAEHKTDLNRFFTLEQRTFVAGLDLTETRDFILPIGEPQNKIVWAEGVETGTHKQYDLQYPFKIRWEDWRVLFFADNDFPNATQDWVTYINADWNIKVNIYKEIDLAQDLGVPACSTTFVVNKALVTISTQMLLAAVPTWTDLQFGVVQTTNQLIYNSGQAINRDLVMTAEDCSAFTQFSSSSADFQGVLDFSLFVGLLELNLISQIGTTDLILPASGGEALNLMSTSITTVDATGFTGLKSWSISSCLSLTSVSLPTLAPSSTLLSFSMHNTSIGTIDLIPVLPAMYDGHTVTLFKCKLTVAAVDKVLVDLDSTGYINGALNIIQTPSSPPTGGAGNANVVSLLGKGWTVTHD